MPSIFEIFQKTLCPHSQRLISKCSVINFRMLCAPLKSLEVILYVSAKFTIHGPFHLQIPSERPDKWSNITQDVSVMVFLDEINISGLWVKHVTLRNTGWASADQPKAWIEHNTDLPWGRGNLPADSLRGWIAGSAPPWITGLKALALELQILDLSRLHNLVSQFPNVNLSVFTFHRLSFTGDPWLIKCLIKISSLTMEKWLAASFHPLNYHRTLSTHAVRPHPDLHPFTSSLFPCHLSHSQAPFLPYPG